MNTVLTDEEIYAMDCLEIKSDAFDDCDIVLESVLEFARAIEATVLAKFGEPVAWMHPAGGVLRKLDTGLEKDTYTIPLYAIQKEGA